MILDEKKVEKNGTAQILIVDDEPNILVPLEFLIKQQGYKVEKALNGNEALEKMQQCHPDLVVLDVMMPGMDGFEVARKIRQDPRFNNTHIIFLTAKGAPADRLAGYANGGEIYLTKPFDNDDLIHTVKEIIELG